MVPAAGVEPATFRSGGERSNPLSYAGLNKMACFKEGPGVSPFVTLFVPLVKYSGALHDLRRTPAIRTDLSRHLELGF